MRLVPRVRHDAEGYAGFAVTSAAYREFVRSARLRPYIGNVQVKEGSRKSNAPAGPADSTLSRGGTYDLLLGEGGDMDHMSYLRPLRETGYDGYYMAECHKHPTGEWPSDRIAEHERRQLAALLDRAAS